MRETASIPEVRYSGNNKLSMGVISRGGGLCRGKERFLVWFCFQNKYVWVCLMFFDVWLVVWGFFLSLLLLIFT